MKGIVIYKGRYGATKQYAEWLGAELNLPVRVSDSISGEQLAEYDLLILGGAVYIEKILLKGWLRKNIRALQRKKIFLFMVCGTPPGNKATLESYTQAGVPAEIRNSAEIYYLPGRMKWRDLSWPDRLMLKIGALFAKGSEAKKEMQMEYDNVSKENIRRLADAVKAFCTANTFIRQMNEKPAGFA